MANNIACTVVGREWSHNGTITSEYAQGAGYAGYNGVYYYLYILKFTTPAFSGKSESLTFRLPCDKLTGEKAVLRYAVCTSDANHSSYAYAYGAVADNTQLATGEVTMEGLTTITTYEEIAVQTDQLQPNTSYYLYLWSANGKSDDTGGCVTLMNSAGITVTMGYLSGIVLVQTGEGVKTAFVDVYLNGVWHENCFPDVFVDGVWETCS